MRLVQEPTAEGASLHVVTHEAPTSALSAALEEIARLDDVLATPSHLAVVSDRGFPNLGWS